MGFKQKKGGGRKKEENASLTTDSAHGEAQILWG